MHQTVTEKFEMPAEWEPHEATWLAWPHHRKDWPGKMATIPWVYGEMVKKISAGERVHLIVQSPAQKKRADSILRRVGVDLKQIRFFQFPTDRGWTRDMGPIFVRPSGTIQAQPCRIARFRFNAWAQYPNWQRDARLPDLVAKKLNRKSVPILHDGKPVVLEGGAIDVNGTGTLITTEECLLHPTIQVRNPDFGRKDYEAVFKQYLGARQVLWLDRGIAGDDTHGHVDDLCRFTDDRSVVLCREPNEQDPNHRPLLENRERLQGVNLAHGKKLEVIELPMPAPLFLEGIRLPASYANFYITNSSVIVPTFNDPNDRLAVGILSDLFKSRTVVGIHAVDLVWGLGTIHCLTQQQPI